MDKWEGQVGAAEPSAWSGRGLRDGEAGDFLG